MSVLTKMAVTERAAVISCLSRLLAANPVLGLKQESSFPAPVLG